MEDTNGGVDQRKLIFGIKLINLFMKNINWFFLTARAFVISH